MPTYAVVCGSTHADQTDAELEREERLTYADVC
jgi:hypothetical protein